MFMNKMCFASSFIQNTAQISYNTFNVQTPSRKIAPP